MEEFTIINLSKLVPFSGVFYDENNKKMTKALRKDDSNLVEQKRRSKRKAQKQARKKNR